MWLCPKCKKENDDKTIICPQCGFDESKNYAEYWVLRGLSDKECQVFNDDFKNSRVNIIEKYKKLAEQGNVEAQKLLANCYYYGHGVEQDYEKAAQWWCRVVSETDALKIEKTESNCESKICEKVDEEDCSEPLREEDKTFKVGSIDILGIVFFTVLILFMMCILTKVFFWSFG